MVDEDAEYPLKMPSAEMKEPVEALGADGADEALGDGVRFRPAHRCADDLEAFRFGRLGGSRAPRVRHP